MNEENIVYKHTHIQVDIGLAIYRNSCLQMFHKVGLFKFLQTSQ